MQNIGQGLVVSRVPISAFRRAAVEMQMLVQFFSPRTIELLADAGHARAQNL
jgi:hypothetical protein